MALQSLFAGDMKGSQTEFSLDWLLEEDPLPAKYQAFAKELLAGVADRKSELDQTILHYAPAWPVAQLPAVDRNILRIALFELKHHRETPNKTAINEAVELAKTFGSEGGTGTGVVPLRPMEELGKIHGGNRGISVCGVWSGPGAGQPDSAH